jgi:hypothetical protein
MLKPFAFFSLQFTLKFVARLMGIKKAVIALHNNSIMVCGTGLEERG